MRRATGRAGDSGAAGEGAAARPRGPTLGRAAVSREGISGAVEERSFFCLRSDGYCGSYRTVRSCVRTGCWAELPDARCIVDAYDRN